MSDNHDHDHDQAGPSRRRPPYPGLQQREQGNPPPAPDLYARINPSPTPSPALGSSSTLSHGSHLPPPQLGSSNDDPGRSPAAPHSAQSVSSRTRRRPAPLNLGRSAGLEVGQDEERSAQLEVDGFGPGTARSAITLVTSDDEDEGGDGKAAKSEPDGVGGADLEKEIDDLSLLRRDVQANLRERPLDSPLSLTHSTSDVEHDRSPSTSPPSHRHHFSHSQCSLPALKESEYLSVSSLLDTARRRVVFDIRPLQSFLASRLPGSFHLSIPPMERQRYNAPGSGGHNSMNWATLEEYLTPRVGKEAFQAIFNHAGPEWVILGSGDAGQKEEVQVYKAILDDVAFRETASRPAVSMAVQTKVVRGGWTAVLADKAVSATLITGDTSSEPSTQITSLPPPLKTAPLRSAFPYMPPPPIPVSPTTSTTSTTLPHKVSMPSLRPATAAARKNVPALSIQTSAPTATSSNRPPKLSLQLDKPTRSSTTGGYPNLHLNIPPAIQSHPTQDADNAKSPLSLAFPTSADGRTFSSTPGVMTAEPPGSTATVGSSTATATATAKWLSPTPRDQDRRFEPPQTAALPTASTRGNAVAPFIVSTILPSFLYLGPEITSRAEIDALRDLGIKRILNVAAECEDDQELGLSRSFDKYTKLPMRDIVEETGVSGYMREACDLLDDARLHSAPVYVHCKAGKSRSVTVVLAYLIHANAWTLKTAYAYVAERRKGISPNIGFVAELMSFEETELGLKHSSGVHGDVPQPKDKDKDTGDGNGGQHRQGQAQRYGRDSLPPTWIAGPSSSFDSRPPERLPLAHTPDPEGSHQTDSQDREEGKGRTLRDDREVMKNGQWVQQRRVPVDRTTLQPGRRASKAGLESLRSDHGTGGDPNFIEADLE